MTAGRRAATVSGGYLWVPGLASLTVMRLDSRAIRPCSACHAGRSSQCRAGREPLSEAREPRVPSPLSNRSTRPQRIPRVLIGGIVAITAATVTACSSDDGVGAVPTDMSRSESTTMSPELIDPASTSSEAPSTAAPSASVAPTTPPPTTSTAVESTTSATAMSSTTTVVPQSSTSPPVYGSAEEQVTARFVEYWDARHQVLAADTEPDPNDSRLAAHAVGEQLEVVRAEVQRYRDEGRRLTRAESPVNYQVVTVVSVDGDTAEVQECFVDDGVIVDRATGAVLNDRVVTLNSQAVLRRVDGLWKLAEYRVIQSWEGVAGCALAS